MYNRDDNLCIVKSVEKLMDWVRTESQGRNIQNTALGWHAGIQEHQMAYLCLHG